MRILVCNWRDGSHPQAGGAEVYTEEVLARWVAAGHEVTLFSAAQADRPERETVRGVHRVRRGGKLGVYREARRWFLAEGVGQFDLVIDEVNTRPFFCHEYSDAPVVALFHQTCEEIWSHEMPWPESWFGRRVLEPRWLRRMAGVPSLAVSESTRDAIAAFGVGGIDGAVVVPEGIVPPAPVSVGKAEVPTLIHCGRLVSYKQVDHVLQAVHMARKELPELRLLVVGDGPQREKLEKLAHDGDVFTGFVPASTKVRLMAESHAIVMASTREGWGLVIAEAAALGTTAIAYDRPGLRDAVTAAGGTLVPADPAALAAWIVAELPRLVGVPGRPVPLGGVKDWDDVAVDVLAAAVAAAGTEVMEPAHVG
jgi:glycosyltransferase involved in cell wall biosynthesis